MLKGGFTVKAEGRVLKSSPRKLNLVAGLIRGQKASAAMMCLTFCKKKAAVCVKKVLNSAIANAQYNYNMDVDALYIDEVLVGKSLTLRRVHPRAMGKAYRVRKRYGNVTIKLLERV